MSDLFFFFLLLLTLHALANMQTYISQTGRVGPMWPILNRVASTRVSFGFPTFYTRISIRV